MPGNDELGCLYFGNINNKFFFKDQEDVNSRSVRPSTSYTFVVYAQTEWLAHGTVQCHGRGHRPTPDPVTAKMMFF